MGTAEECCGQECQPFPCIKPQNRSECGRGMGLAGQTDIHIDSESILIALQCYIINY